MNKWPEDSAWDFVAVGRGHDTEFWARFLQALEAVDPDMWVNIEHEDVAFGPLGGPASRRRNAQDRQFSQRRLTGR